MDMISRAQAVHADFKARIMRTLRRHGSNQLAYVESWDHVRTTVSDNRLTVHVNGVESVSNRLVDELPRDYIIEAWRSYVPATALSMNPDGALPAAPLLTLSITLRWRFNYLEYVARSLVHSLYSLFTGLLWLLALTIFVVVAWWALHMLASRILPSVFGSADTVPSPLSRLRSGWLILSWRFWSATAANVSGGGGGETEDIIDDKPPPPPRQVAPRHAKPPVSTATAHQRRVDKPVAGAAAVGLESPPIAAASMVDYSDTDSANDYHQAAAAAQPQQRRAHRQQGGGAASAPKVET